MQQRHENRKTYFQELATISGKIILIETKGDQLENA